ncbi:LacI family DNA-binding transcriptional regulator [Kiloniella laminariae]|uniref:LacI family DNA-binding transcriptional regulator n=1 Tax=Kiloniella laminariae TaxID=454162 RepID=A0ABT4LGJ6_9PROT|nr:LacI family DNA-binding transcriptional regulator [Kiloniella laminariae]MCZ4280213.1 LacI family DNA-binding transcriptional regulator [Kiloniella laminariae]
MTHKNITSADVARMAGVSRSTVSRCFKADSRISKKTRERVIEIADQLGYQVNKIARSMITRQSDLVGLVSAGLHDPFAVVLINQLIQKLQKMGLHPILLDASNTQQLELSIKKLAQYQVRSIIITSGSPSSSIGAEFIRLNIPVILLNRAGQLDAAHLINCDNKTGSTLAAKTLLDAGHRRLAFVNSINSTYSGNSRGAFFEQALALKLASGEISLQNIPCRSSDYQGGFQAALDLFANRPPSDQSRSPTGIYCANDNVALGFMDALRHELGLRVPEDLSVIGFDDIPLAGQPAYRLTTLRQCPEAIAEATAKCIQDIPSSTSPQRITIPVKLITRHSVAPAAN